MQTACTKANYNSTTIAVEDTVFGASPLLKPGSLNISPLGTLYDYLAG